MNTVAVVGWIVIFGALFTWQTMGLLRGSGWPTMSDMLRASMRPLAGRWLLFGVWLWVGWHVFVRDWEFFMRDRL